MSTSGMARKVDDLGRIVLPVEMRRMFGIQPGDALGIAVENGGIVLRKVETRCVFCDGAEGLQAFRDKQVCAACAREFAATGSGAEHPPQFSPPPGPPPAPAPWTEQPWSEGPGPDDGALSEAAPPAQFNVVDPAPRDP